MAPVAGLRENGCYKDCDVFRTFGLSAKQFNLLELKNMLERKKETSTCHETATSHHKYSLNQNLHHTISTA